MPTEAADATSRMHNTHIIVVVVEIRRAKLEFIIGSINHPVGTGIPIDADVTTWLQKIHTADAEIRRVPPVGSCGIVIVDGVTIRIHKIRIATVGVVEDRRAKLEIFLA